MLVRPTEKTEIKRGREIVVPDYEVARRRMASEITRSPVSDNVPVPEEGAMFAAKERGDIFLTDPQDEGQEKGAFAWISADDWSNPTQLWQVHAWGPSERHLDILIDICQWAVDNLGRLADLPVSYDRSSHPMTVIADNYADVTFSRDGRKAITTYRTALAGLMRRREEVRGGVDASRR